MLSLITAAARQGRRRVLLGPTDHLLPIKSRPPPFFWNALLCCCVLLYKTLYMYYIHSVACGI